MRGEGIIEDTLTLMKSREPSIQETRELEKKLSIMDEADLEELETQVKKLKNIEEKSIGIKEDKRTKAYKEKKKLEDEISKNRAMVEERERIKRKIIRRGPKIEEYNINKEKLKRGLANALKNKIMGKVITKKRIQEKQEALNKKIKEDYENIRNYFYKNTDPLTSLMGKKKTDVFNIGQVKARLLKFKIELGKAFEKDLSDPDGLGALFMIITGIDSPIIINDNNPRISGVKDIDIGGKKFSKRDLYVFDLSTKNADYEAKNFVFGMGNSKPLRSTDKIPLIGTKIKGSGGFTPWYIEMPDGSVKLFNVENINPLQGEERWVNADYYKDAFVIFLLEDGIFLYNIIDNIDKGLVRDNNRTITHNGENLTIFSIKSKNGLEKHEWKNTDGKITNTEYVKFLSGGDITRII
jgi:hypothetical protein